MHYYIFAHINVCRVQQSIGIDSSNMASAISHNNALDEFSRAFLAPPVIFQSSTDAGAQKVVQFIMRHLAACKKSTGSWNMYAAWFPRLSPWRTRESKKFFSFNICIGAQIIPRLTTDLISGVPIKCVRTDLAQIWLQLAEFDSSPRWKSWKNEKGRFEPWPIIYRYRHMCM